MKRNSMGFLNQRKFTLIFSVLNSRSKSRELNWYFSLLDKGTRPLSGISDCQNIKD